MLHAYVDDRLDAGQRAKMERRLAADPELRRRVNDWQAQDAVLRDALSFKLREPVPPSLSVAALAEARMRTTTRPVARWRMAAGFVLALGLGAAGGWFGHRMMPFDEIALLGMESASAYRVFANDPARAIEVSSSNRAEMAAWMTQKLGRRVVLPDLSSVGYSLLGGRVLSTLSGAAAMLIYESAGGDRLTVYVRPMGIGREAEMQLLDVKALEGYGWINRQIGYSVMSDGDRELLRPVAHLIRDELKL
ncbi:anti-sigma factor family protein [Roseomonas populi]|uniref:Anti-sigma factor n=1 Tax=Roseomonas populi TaxID=3121582 RepID=A0ABT1X9V6_9PROT|nr:anti-sigma factor [Roseomonas pecuniae]MCR0984893.1 anti-sigma factor [Roseomonas pecuniae]